MRFGEGKTAPQIAMLTTLMIINALTPLEALNKLYEMKRRRGGGGKWAAYCPGFGEATCEAGARQTPKKHTPSPNRKIMAQLPCPVWRGGNGVRFSSYPSLISFASLQDDRTQF
jgi:hypothetical protein